MLLLVPQTIKENFENLVESARKNTEGHSEIPAEY